MGFVVLIWFLSVIAFFLIWSDASEKHGKNIGCLWALAVLALGPIAVIGYLLFGRSTD